MFSKKLTVAGLILFSSLVAQDELCYAEYCEESCDREFFWIGGEYIYWKVKDSPAPPPLVIQGPTSGAILGDPGTRIVLGNKKIESKWRSGGRFSLGFWLGEAQCYALEGTYFFLPTGSKSKSVRTASLNGDPQLSIPFFNPLTNLEDTYFLSLENTFRGLATLKVKNKMQGAEANLWIALTDPCSFRLDLLLGFRYWNFHEKTLFSTSSPFIALPNDIWRTKDTFAAINNFYGGQLGIRFDYSYCRFFCNASAKVALGADRGKMHIKGRFITNEFNPVFGEGPGATFRQGIFALPTNIGDHSKTFFSVLAEGNVNAGFQFFECLVQFGYTILYVNKAFWASNQIDRTLNFTQSVVITDSPNAVLVGPKRPRFPHKKKDLWAHGGSVGLIFSY